MSIFQRQINFIDEFESSINETFKSTIESFGFVMKDFIVNKQLFQKGIDGNEKRLQGYKRTTIRIKIGKGQPVDRTTLHDQEKFVGSIDIDAFSDRFEVSSNVSYDKFIIKRYGKGIFKLTDENMREFMVNYFLPNLKRNNNDKLSR